MLVLSGGGAGRLGAAPSTLPREELVELRAEVAADLHENILAFWLRAAPDPATGTFHGAVWHGRPLPDADRGALLTARILWAFANAYRRDGDVVYRAMADRAYRDLMVNFWDDAHGGLFWTITAAGAPQDTNKIIYGQAFGIYALTEYFRATGEPAALARAQELYRLVEAHGVDPAQDGYLEGRARDWGEPDPDERARVEPAEKSQNTHLHVMEAYTNLLRVWPDDGLRARQTALIHLMLERILDPTTHHLRLWFDRDWTPTSLNVSYGHDIEASWLLTEAADELGDATLQARVHTLAVQMAGLTLNQGVDPDGGMIYEAGPDGAATNPGKDWWPQAEAVVGFLNALQLSGDQRFLGAAQNSWRFIAQHIVNRDLGGWRWGVTRDLQPVDRPEISLWKCPYHNSRAAFEAMDRIDALLAALDVADGDRF